jgi:DsbC/DsbD-like thiol-disulfide interchange protein
VLELAATLGVCSEICIPAQAQFSLPLVDGGADRPNGLRIRQALATAPMAWQGDPQPVGDVAFDAAAGHLEVEISDSDVDRQSLIVAVDDGRPLFGTPQKSPQPNLVLLPVLGEGDLDLLGRSVQLTFMTGMGAFEVTRTISPAGD